MVLLTFLFALITAVGAYGLLLAWQQGGSPAPVDFEPPTLPADPPAPRPLPSVPPRVAPAAGDPAAVPDAGGGIAVEIQGPAGPAAPLGVAVLSGELGVPLGYQPVRPAELPFEVRFTDLPAGEHMVCLVRAASDARHGYLDRASVTVRPGAIEHASLSARTQDLRIQLVCPAGPQLVAGSLHVLERVDEPAWRPVSFTADPLEAPMLMTDDDGVLWLRSLGPGRYALDLTGLWAVDGDPDGRYSFEIPGPDRLTVNCRPRSR